MSKSNKSRPSSKAVYRLNRSLLLKYVRLAGQDKCYRCGKVIECVSDFSIDHKTPWRHAPNAEELFYDLDNIAFSHLLCNSLAARRKRIHATIKDRKRADRRLYRARHRDKVNAANRERIAARRLIDSGGSGLMVDRGNVAPEV